jgi:hypothetical protein
LKGWTPWSTVRDGIAGPKIFALVFPAATHPLRRLAGLRFARRYRAQLPKIAAAIRAASALLLMPSAAAAAAMLCHQVAAGIEGRGSTHAPWAVCCRQPAWRFEFYMVYSRGSAAAAPAEIPA